MYDILTNKRNAGPGEMSERHTRRRRISYLGRIATQRNDLDLNKAGVESHKAHVR